MTSEVKTAKNSKLPKLPENCFEPVGKGGWPPISTWITSMHMREVVSRVHHMERVAKPETLKASSLT
jgi:hypothetical protein